MEVVKQVKLVRSHRHYWHRDLVGEILNVVGTDSGPQSYYLVELTPEQQTKTIRKANFVVNPMFCKDHYVITNNQEGLILLRR